MPKVGDTLPLSLQLFDGATNKFCRAIISDALGTPLGASPVTLSHIGNGRYENDSILMPSGTAFVACTYEVFNDALFTVPSADHSSAIDTFPLEIPFTEILDCLTDIKLILTQLQAEGIFAISGADCIAVLADDNDLKADISENISLEAVVDDTDLEMSLGSSDKLEVSTGDNDLNAKIEEC